MRQSDTVRAASDADAHKAISLAIELVASAEAAMAVGHWRVVGLNAVHAGICAADAALIASAGVRSAAKDHGAAADLLARSAPTFKMTQRRQLTGLLKQKSAIAYEQRNLTEVEARVMLDQARRFVAWAASVVGPGQE